MFEDDEDLDDAEKQRVVVSNNFYSWMISSKCLTCCIIHFFQWNSKHYISE